MIFQVPFPASSSLLHHLPRLIQFFPIELPGPHSLETYFLTITYKRRHTIVGNMAGRAGMKRDANHLTTPEADSKKPKANGSITSFFGAPKSKPNDPKPTSSSSSFNKQKWVDSLTPEQKELLQLEIDTLDESWLAQLKEEVVKPEFLALKRFLQKEKQSGAKIFPPEEDIYSW